MAVTSNTLIGKTRGSIGGVTFSSWKGLNVAKSKPTSVANPRTPGQVTNRLILAFTVALFRQAPSIFNVGFIQQAIVQSAFNAFVAANILNGAIIGDATEAEFDPQNFEPAKGTMAQTPITGGIADFSLKSVTLTFATTPLGDQTALDIPIAIVTTHAGLVLGFTRSTAGRAEGEIDIATPGMPSVGTMVHAYLFFYNAGTRKVSNSIRLGTAVVA